MVYGRFENTPGDIHRRVINTNLIGQIHGARAVLPQFRRQSHGIPINVASLYAKMTSPYVSAYVTSKFAILGFSEVLRQELQDAPDIQVCSVLPASVDTPIFRHAGNYTGRVVRPVPPVSDPDRVVRSILRCVERPRREITVGQVGHLLAWAHAAAPGLYDRLVPYVMDWVALGGETADSGPGNVIEPMPEWNRVTGQWRHRRQRAIRLAALAVAAAVPIVLESAATPVSRRVKDPTGRKGLDMTLLVDPPLLVGTGAAIARLAPDERRARWLECAALAAFLGAGVSLYCNASWMEWFRRPFPAESGRDFMLNSMVFHVEYRHPRPAVHIGAAAVFATYPLWLRLGGWLARRRGPDR